MIMSFILMISGLQYILCEVSRIELCVPLPGNANTLIKPGCIKLLTPSLWKEMKEPLSTYESLAN